MQDAIRLCATGLLAAGLAACASRTTGGPAPVDADEQHATTWDYVSARYDANRDGVVEREEYGRKSFHRLDRNRDGRLDRADFTVPEDPGDPMRVMGTELMVLWYFQDDDDPTRLGRAELARAFDVYDTGGDGLLDQEEFGCAAEERGRLGLPPNSESLRKLPAFELFQKVIDSDADGLVGANELDDFFALRDDGDDMWRPGPGSATAPGQEPAAKPSPPATAQLASGQPTATRTTVAAQGRPAPDFTLGRLGGGGGEITLSDYVDDRPVALIFGSYT